MEWPEITVNTTMEEIKKLHKKIWNYVIAYGSKPSTPYSGDCVLCEFDIAVRDGFGSRCELCPSRLGGFRGRGSHCLMGLWTNWRNAAMEIKNISIYSEEEMRGRIKSFNRRYGKE